MSVEIPNPLVLSPENVLATGAASEAGLDAITAKVEELRATTSSPGLNTQELLGLILAELRVLNFYLYELPRMLNAGEGYSPHDAPDRLRDQNF